MHSKEIRKPDCLDEETVLRFVTSCIQAGRIPGTMDLLILHPCEEEGMAGDGFSGTGTGTALGQGGYPGLVALAAAYLKEGTDYGTDHIP